MNEATYITERQRELTELRERHDRYLRYTEEAKPSSGSESAWTTRVELSESVDRTDGEFAVRRRADELARAVLDEYCDKRIKAEIHRALRYISGDRNRDVATHYYGEPESMPSLEGDVFGALMLIRYADQLRGS